MKKIIIVGGGPAGTAAAHRLGQLGYAVTIVEKSSRLGGRICSIQPGEESFEMGAGFITSGLYRNVFKLLEDTALKSDLSHKKSNGAVVKDSKAHAAHSLLRNDWLPLGAKLLAILQIVKILPHWTNLDIKQPTKAARYDHTSISDNFKTKQGERLLEYLIQPILNSYLYWKPEGTSFAFLNVLIKTSLFKGKTCTLKHGLAQIPATLAQDVQVEYESEVTKVRKTNSGQYEIAYRKNGELKELIVEGVVCATTATFVPKIIEDLSVEEEKFFAAITYSSTVVVANTYTQTMELPNYEFAFPRNESQPMTAITMQTITKTKDSYLRIVKAFASGETANELLELDDKQIQERLSLPSLATSKIGSTENPSETYLQRWNEALPEFTVGYLERLKEFTELEQKKTERLVYAGDYIGGPYIEGAVTSGFSAANLLHAKLGS